MERLIKTILFTTVFLLCYSCEYDVLENYRREYSGSYEFTTIRENMTSVPPIPIDTTVFSGSIEPVYSNRKDLVRILFMPELKIDVVLSEAAYLSLPAVPSEGSRKTLSGFFTEGSNRVEFSYRVSSGSEYSVNHTVTGLRIK